MTACTPERPCGESDRCDECAADLLLLRRYVDPYAAIMAGIECPECHGDGTIVREHVRFGALDCPDPYTEQDCRSCGGRGRI